MLRLVSADHTKYFFFKLWSKIKKFKWMFWSNFELNTEINFVPNILSQYFVLRSHLKFGWNITALPLVIFHFLLSSPLPILGAYFHPSQTFELLLEKILCSKVIFAEKLFSRESFCRKSTPVSATWTTDFFRLNNKSFCIFQQINRARTFNDAYFLSDVVNI